MNKNIYSGFFIRVFAWILDNMILFIPFSLVVKVFHSNTIVSIFIYFIILWLYSSLLISSSLQATLGKKILSIKILTLEMQQLSFKQASVRYVYSTISYIFILPLFTMFFTKKRQTFHDYFASTVVIDEVGRYNYEKSLQNSKRKLTYFRTFKNIKDEEPKKRGIFVKIIIFLIILAIAVPVGWAIFYTSIMYKLYSDTYKDYDNSFKQHYTTNDYNNSKIIFYNQELETNSQKLIEAKGMYEIFEADVKKDLSLNCIEYFLAREHNVSDWIEFGSRFRKNARNKYANTEALIKKAKKNEDHMGEYFYYYDLNDVNHIADDIADKWKKDANTETCQKMLPVDQMYTMFVMQYIKNREEALENNKHNYQYAKPSGILNKSFYEKKIEETSTWLEMLYEKHPIYFKDKEKARREKAISDKRAYDKAVKDMQIKEKKYKRAEKAYRDSIFKKYHLPAEYPIFSAIINKNNIELYELIALNTDIEVKNKAGLTPLFEAVKQNNLYAVNTLLENGAYMYETDYRKMYTIFTWAINHNNIEIVKLFLSHGVNINYQFDRSETAITIASQGCSDFELMQLLIDNGADTSIKDRYGYNTEDSLNRNCSDKKKRAKVMKIIGDSFFDRINFTW